MRLLKEKVPKKGVSPSMALLVIAVAGTAILSLGATIGQQVFAQANAPPDHTDGSGFSEGHGTPREDPGTPVLDDISDDPITDPQDGTEGVEDPNCWGDVTVQLAQQEDTNPGLGKDHASTFSEPRDGVGNQASDGITDDTPAEHGDRVGDMADPDIECVIE
jgi:hypothetical protein